MGLKSNIVFYLRRWGRRYLPESTITAIRKPFQLIRSKKRNTQRREGPVYNLDELKSALTSAGFASGDIIMVHSSLSRIGNVDGGAQTVVQSIVDIVTASGTIIMPCYNSAEAMLKELRHNKLIDLRVSPSAVGKITDVFRTWPDVLRSSHPFSSSCAWGKDAKYIISGHAEFPDVCHEESPVGRLLRLRGKVVGIGIPIAQGLGVAHYLEDTWSEFPFEVHDPPIQVAYIDAEGNRVERSIRRFNPDVAKTRIDHPEGAWICQKMTEHFIRKGILRSFKYGSADSWVMDAQALYQELKKLAQKNVTMYLTEKALKPINKDILNW